MKASEIKRILICGAGMMGKNIAFVFSSNPDYQVGVYDLYDTDVKGGDPQQYPAVAEKGRADRVGALRTAGTD